MPGRCSLPDVDSCESSDVYGRIVASFHLGHLRFWRAEAAAARLIVALLEFRAQPRTDFTSHTYRSVLENLAKIPYDSYDALAYVTNVSHLVYATTLLDSFLSDTTLFLLLKFPRVMGEKRHVLLGSILQGSSIHSVITKEATSKTRETSFLPFPARVQFLREAFGLRVSLEPETLTALGHYPSIRNAAVHDQGIFELMLDNNGKVVSRQKTCPRHPTPVTADDVERSMECYTVVAGSIARAVFSQVLKVGDHPSLEAFSGVPEDSGNAARNGGD